MAGLFKKLNIVERHTLSKADKKKYNKLSNGLIDVKDELTLYVLSSRTKIIRKGGSSLFFEHYELFGPTINNFKNTAIKRVYLNDGAIKPIKDGADVMVPGVLLFADRCEPFMKDEIIGVEINNYGIIGVGITLMSLEEAKKLKRGVLIRLLHVEGDELYLDRF